MVSRGLGVLQWLWSRPRESQKALMVLQWKLRVIMSEAHRAAQI